MRIALGSDERTELTDAIAANLRERGDDVMLFGALADSTDDAWTSVARAVGTAVASGECGFGILCCWTGTGVSIAANKIPGVRAALCTDAQTAEGARVWNDANVLCLSLRATSIPVAQEILTAWFAGQPTTDPRYRAMIEEL
jgi:ribose 5-phosphate isomerase B